MYRSNLELALGAEEDGVVGVERELKKVESARIVSLTWAVRETVRAEMRAAHDVC